MTREHCAGSYQYGHSPAVGAHMRRLITCKSCGKAVHALKSGVCEAHYPLTADPAVERRRAVEQATLFGEGKMVEV